MGQVDGEKLVNKLNNKFGKSHAYYKVAIPQDISKLCKAKHVVGAHGTPGLDYRECFSVVHYAGVVTYTVQNFIPKSRDSLEGHVTEIFQKSKNENVQAMFNAKAESAGA